jgi:tetratricopeptide (TPR) repeat protein
MILDSFSECLLRLRYTNESVPFLGKFVVDKFSKTNFDDIGPTCLQLFEPDILNEISILYNFSIEQLENFDYQSDSSENLSNLQWLLRNRNFLSAQQKINFSYSLATLARYKLARLLITDIDYEKLSTNWKLHYLFCDFCIDNRLEGSKRSEAIFAKVKEFMENGKVNNRLTALFVSQYIVWSLKSLHLTKIKDYMYSQAIQLVDTLEDEVSKEINLTNNYLVLSGFYRAIAMIPAKDFNKQKTRSYMEKSLEYAERIIPRNIFEEYNKKNLLKTYYESTIKEYIYLHSNLDVALENALKMLEVEPNWSISWQQLGEIYIKRNDFALALDAYTKAYNIGIPRKIESLFYIAYCHSELGDIQKAIELFIEIVSIDKKNISSVINGYNLSKQHNFSKETSIFMQKLIDFNREGLINKQRFKDIIGE